jgi:hypothetical protein
MLSIPSNPVTSIRSVLPLCHREGLRTYASTTFSGPPSRTLTDAHDADYQNKVASFTSDISDISDSTSNNIKMLADVKTDEQIQRPSDLSVISDVTTDMQFNSEQKSRNIKRLGRSDTWVYVKIVNKKVTYTT